MNHTKYLFILFFVTFYTRKSQILHYDATAFYRFSAYRIHLINTIYHELIFFMNININNTKTFINKKK